MKTDVALRRLFLSIVWIIAGLALVVLGITNVLDSYFSGCGSALFVVGIFQVVRYIRYRTNQEYKEKVDIEVNDERNKFLSSQAWAWTGYIFVLCCAVASIVYRVIGQEENSSLCAMAICLMVVIYIIAYMILTRKY